MAVENNGFVTIPGIDPEAKNGSDVFPAYLIPGEDWNGAAMPAFDRETAERVVEWTNRVNANASCGERATWDGDTVVLTAFDGEEIQGVTRYAADEDGRYWIGARAWVWESTQNPSQDGTEGTQA